MPIVVDAALARAERKAVEVKGYTNTSRPEDMYYATLYMGAPPDIAAAAMQVTNGDKSLPQAYLVEQPPASTVPPHFHDTDQFQVFIEGEAEFGKKLLKSVSVHYAGGHTPYGPIVTRDTGTHYLTLRARWDSGGKPMPKSRDLLKRGVACHRVAEDINLSGATTRACDNVLPVEHDGLGAAVFHLQPGEQITLDLDVAGAGQYAFVARGTVVHDRKTLVERSCVYRYANEGALSVTAGADGAAVLLMQFPVHAAS